MPRDLFEVAGIKPPPEKQTNILEDTMDLFERKKQESLHTINLAYETYKRNYGEGQVALKKAFTDPSFKNTLKGAVGALQYVFSPLTGAVEGLVGQPTEDTLRQLGLSEGAAKFGRGLTEAAAYMYSPGSTIKKLMQFKIAPGAIAEKEIAALAKLPDDVFDKKLYKSYLKEQSKEIKIPKRGTYPEGATIEKGTALTKGQIRQELTEDIARGAEEVLAGKMDKSKKIFENITHYLKSGEIQPEHLPEILNKYNITPEQFAQQYMDTISTAGRQLNQLSRLSKRLKATFKESDEAEKIFEELHNQYLEAMNNSWGTRIAETWYKVENFRRGMMVTQVATAVRNAVSQAGRLTIGAVDDSFQAVLRSVFGGEKFDMNQVRAAMSSWQAMLAKMSPKNRARTLQIMRENADAISSARLISTPVHEATLGGKFSNALNALNRAQEFFFRRLAFEGKMRQNLARAGLRWETVDPKKIPEGMIEDAVEYALEMTYARMPKGQAARKFIEGWAKTPLTTVNPYPRFAFGNAIPFILEHSPLGYLQAVGPKTLKELASGNPDRFVKAASRATLGTMMLDQAINIRNNPDIAGERWYEIKVGKKKVGSSIVLDTRAYAPLNFYLFAAEAMKPDNNITPADYVQATIGLNRIAGSGLVMTDWLRARKGETVAQSMKRFLGAYAGGFTVPLRTPKDIVAGFSEEEAKFRDTREYPFVGPTLANIPVVSQQLPESKSPLKTAGFKSEHPILRQLTGLGVKTKTMIEREIDDIGLPFSRVAPRTGYPEADRKMSEYMAPMVEKVMPFVILNPNYQRQSKVGKRIIMAEAFKKIRNSAKQLLKAKNPEVAIVVQIEGMQDDMLEFIKEKTGKDLMNLKRRKK